MFVEEWFRSDLENPLNPDNVYLDYSLFGPLKVRLPHRRLIMKAMEPELPEKIRFGGPC
jgi:hypothetical protein